MKVENFGLKKKFLHLHRLSFSVWKISGEKKFYESKINSFITLGATIMILGVLFFFTDYKENILKVGIFAVFFNLYKIYQAYFVPILLLNENGIELRAVKIPWTNIKRIELNWQNHNFRLKITLINQKVMNEKIEGFHFMNSIYLGPTIRAFKRKYRNKYTF